MVMICLAGSFLYFKQKLGILVIYNYTGIIASTNYSNMSPLMRLKDDAPQTALINKMVSTSQASQFRVVI